jgi:electron transfer flavoprotein alpha subunit
MTERNAPVWVIAEADEGQIKPVSLQLVGKARTIADQLRSPLECVLLGYFDPALAKSLIAAGADHVYLGNSSKLDHYQPELYLATIQNLAEEKRPEIILLGSTFIGRELAPLLAARLKTGLSAHCIDLIVNQDKVLEQLIPAYGGLITIICPEKRPQMATVAEGVFPFPALDAGREGEISVIKVPDIQSPRVEVLEVVINPKTGVALETAEVVVAGGAGAGDIEGWAEIAELADLLNAGLGSTRPAVDEGWIELETMIGQSGKMVNPKVYIGIGLSGELQHMVGLMGPKVMIAINNDNKAPVFEQVDYGIVEDCRVFVPALLKKLKKKSAPAGSAIPDQ